MLHAYENAADAFTSTADERALEPDGWWIKRVADTTGLSIAFGVFDGTSLEGTVALEFNAKPKTRHKALVIGMYVMPSSRGKGAARLLLQAALVHCVARQTTTSGPSHSHRWERPGSGAVRIHGLQAIRPRAHRHLNPGGLSGQAPHVASACRSSECGRALRSTRAPTAMIPGTLFGTPRLRTAMTPIPRFAGSPEFPLRVDPSGPLRLMTFLRATERNEGLDSVDFDHVSFVTLTSKTR
jgi:GNAT superfamily N-acetyltransferase